ncbi:MAG: transglutaminase family protein [Synechococcaceae cyanobacterium]|nr:transglutaminase family protein [Synechococcaceae cyanobacterium]
MRIQLGCELEIDCEQPTPMLALVHPHASRRGDLVEPEILNILPDRTTEVLVDRSGNRWCRFLASAGRTRFRYATLLRDGGLPDPRLPEVGECPVGALPVDSYRYLNPSRYCDTDRLSELAWRTFAHTRPGWSRVQAICDWVHATIAFDHDAASSGKNASDTLREGAGVCRDFAHLAITLCRCLNLPARYCTGYLGDTGVPAMKDPIDFSAWFEVFLADRWYVFDARYNVPRIGRVLIARGRDAADVPFLRSFGPHQLAGFRVITAAEALPAEGERGRITPPLPLPPPAPGGSAYGRA